MVVHHVTTTAEVFLALSVTSFVSKPFTNKFNNVGIIYGKRCMSDAKNRVCIYEVSWNVSKEI